MKKIILISLVALGIMACESKKTSEEQTEKWMQYIVGEWFYESVTGDSSAPARYQITLHIKADGKMTETEHYILPATDENPAVDRDGNIFEGAWKIQNDTLVKKGDMKVITEKGLLSNSEPERKVREVTGYTKIANVLPDSLITLDKQGNTIVFIRK